MTCNQKMYIYCGYTLKINYLVLTKNSPWAGPYACACPDATPLLPFTFIIWTKHLLLCCLA